MEWGEAGGHEKKFKDTKNTAPQTDALNCAIGLFDLNEVDLNH